jgi:hypothetical protein
VEVDQWRDGTEPLNHHHLRRTSIYKVYKGVLKLVTLDHAMSNKRQRSTSPAPSPSIRSKPTHPDKGKAKASHQEPLHTISDLFPYQEIFIRILSFLTPTDLAAIQNVNKYWAHMSLDPQVSYIPHFQAWPMYYRNAEHWNFQSYS